MAAPLPLVIQSLGTFADQTLVLLHVAQLQNTEGMASPAEVKITFGRLRIPPPSNVSQFLSVLAGDKYAMQPGTGRWAVTPKGEERIRQLMGSVEDTDLGQLGKEARDADFGNVSHHLLPYELAPPAFQQGITGFLEGHPFNRNVFCMTRFPRSDDDVVGPAIDACRSACAGNSLDMHVASDRGVEDILFKNVAAAMWASRYGIAIFENRVGEGVNYNLAFEVGAMLMTGRRCLLLKDATVDKLPTDLVGHIYQSVDLGDLDAVDAVVQNWARKDLGLAP